MQIQRGQGLTQRSPAQVHASTSSAPIAPTEKLKGTLEHIRSQRDGWMLGLIRDPDSGALSAAKGTCIAPQIGATYEFEGRWENHPKYGRGFRFDSYAVELPIIEDAVIAYLQATAKWIGPSIAGAIVNQFGAENAMQVLKSDPERATTIRGITIERALEIQKQLVENERLELVTLQLHDLIADAGLGKATIKKALHQWGHQAYDVVRADPFELTRLHGIGFPSADRVRAKLGIAPEDPYRIRAGILYTLNEACRQNGHTFLREFDFRRLALEALTIPLPLIEAMLPGLVDKNEIVVDPVDLGEASPSGYEIALYATRQAEIGVARKISQMDAFQVGECSIKDLDLSGLAEDQADALTRLVQSKVFILTGAPGTGKTHLVKRIMETFRGQRIALAAPTGKAAQRVTELTGAPARTIHRLLESVPGGPGGFTFKRNEDNPLEESIIIIDEASMVDIHLMASLCDAIPLTARLVLIGDVNQLPSVGPGNVLRDLIRSTLVEVAELRTIKRQDAGDIVRNCHRMRDGLNIVINNFQTKDFFWQDELLEESAANAIVDLVCNRLPGFKDGFDPIRDIQVLSPLRTRGALSCESLNLRLQSHLNPNLPVPGVQFKVCDKVVQTMNDQEHGVFNGEIGVVTAIGKLDPEDTDLTITVVFDSPTRVLQVKNAVADLDLAYCITVHKSQGSEWPVVVMPIHKSQPQILMQRNLLYTAISRAKEVFLGVGHQGEVSKIIRRQSQNQRNTRLEQILRAM